MIRTDDDGELLCPECGGSYLRHHTVTCFDRGEDADTVTVTTVDAFGLSRHTAGNNASGNPSARRDGATVQFTCENCGEPSTLYIAQHKGRTQIGWGP
jgi:ribosomal protein S27AE